MPSGKALQRMHGTGQFEEDVLAGKLGFLKAEVEQANQEGKLRELDCIGRCRD